jgi:chromosome segregation ATPase
MAADEYISVAVSQLRSAATALHDDAQRLQADTYDTERRLKSDIEHSQNEITRLQAELKAQDNMGVHQNRDDITTRISQLQAEISQKQQAAGNKSADAAGVVRQKADLQGRLEGLAAQLESLVAAAR